MNITEKKPDLPFKFLDYYDVRDKEIFFGREIETQILKSDIIVNRLVILFAKTGTGKTSLINAGVTPLLEQLNYKSFYIRVKDNPIEAARNKLRNAKDEIGKELLPQQMEKESLVNQLLYAQKELIRPMVLFFDQFEEFFINISDKKIREEFISDIAEIYHNKKSNIHIVFSMREEYFYAMDSFRDKIPSIFHRGSNLRLLNLDKEQARKVIIKPLEPKLFNVKIEKELVDQILLELEKDDYIEPTLLQIVCDTLWRLKKNNKIRLTDYNERFKSTYQIIEERLGEDIKNLKSDQLGLFEKLLPELKTERNTKCSRRFGELAKTLKIRDTNLLDDLVSKLIELRLIRQSGDRYIEWTIDYLAEHTDDLLRHVKSIAVRRLLKKTMDDADKKRKELINKEKVRKKDSTQEIEFVFQSGINVLNINEKDFDTILKRSKFLKDLTKEETEFLLSITLERGGKYLKKYYHKAYSSNIYFWKILKDKIINSKSNIIKHAENAVILLGEIKTLKAIQLLDLAIEQDVLCKLTLNVLGKMKTKRAIMLLKKALYRKDLTFDVIDIIAETKMRDALRLLEEESNNIELGEESLQKIKGKLEWLPQIVVD